MNLKVNSVNKLPLAMPISIINSFSDNFYFASSTDSSLMLFDATLNKFIET